MAVTYIVRAFGVADDDPRKEQRYTEGERDERNGVFPHAAGLAQARLQSLRDQGLHAELGVESDDAPVADEKGL